MTITKVFDYRLLTKQIIPTIAASPQNSLAGYLRYNIIMTSDDESSRLKKKRVHGPQKFLAKYQEQWPCLRPSKLPHHAFCTLCNYDVDISHQGASGNIYFHIKVDHCACHFFVHIISLLLITLRCILLY